MADSTHLVVVADIVARASPPDVRGLRFKRVLAELAKYFVAQALDPRAVEACVAHACACMHGWPAAARVADPRWWMDIADVDPIGDWDNGERFMGWRLPPDWRMHLARRAVVRLYHPKLEGEVLAGLLAHPALAWLQELRIEFSVGPAVVRGIVERGTCNHLSVLELTYTGLSKSEMKALQRWRAQYGVAEKA